MSDVLTYRDSDDSVLVSWSLPDLPTALHKAGLAGLLCYVKNMPELAPQAAVPILEKEAPHELQVRFTEETLRALMDSVYAGEKHRVESRKKWKNGTLIEERSEPSQLDEDKPPTKIWVYETDRPKVDLIVHWRHGKPEDRWVKLWRDAVRGVLREGRAAEIYTLTTKGKSPTQKSGDLERLWKCLVSAAQGHPTVSKVPTSMFIGAEKKSAERVEFKGKVQHNLLLHFWPFVSPIFVPRKLVRKRGQWAIDFKGGYVFAVAEVGNLEFCDMIADYWRRQAVSSGDDQRPPSHCQIDVAVEGGMAFLHALALSRLDNMGDGDFFVTVPQVDLYHLEKRGDNVQLHVADSIRVSAATLRRYERVADSRRNALFRRLLMRNILDGLPWYARATETLFARYPVELFVCSEKSPGFTRSFGQATREQFKRERCSMNDKRNLAGKIFDIVGEFVANRSEKRSGVDRERLPRDGDGRTKWTSDEGRKYTEAREKVATDAFLAIRGRNADDFVEYFVGSICSVPQFMGAKGVKRRDGFIEIAHALHGSEDRRVEMKNLTMLALSAHAWSQRQSNPSEETRSDTGDAK